MEPTDLDAGHALRRVALLAAALEQRSAEASAQQEQAARQLVAATAALGTEVTRRLDEIDRVVAARAAQVMRDALAAGLADYERGLARAADGLDGATRRAARTLDAMAERSNRQAWAAGAVISGAMALLLAGGSLVLWQQGRAYADGSARLAALAVDREMIQALAQAGVTSCGGQPCLRLDGKRPRWGADGDYVLIRTGPNGPAVR